MESGGPSSNEKQNTILFMQQEHAEMIKGLHEEIAALQKRCKELIFVMTMNGVTFEGSGPIEGEMKALHEELQNSRSRIAFLEKQLSERDKKIEQLELELRAQRKKCMDESRAQTHNMNLLRAELEAKANTVAQLSTEIHKLKHQKPIKNNGEHVMNFHKPDDLSSVYHRKSTFSPGKTFRGLDKSKTHHYFAPAPPAKERFADGPVSAAPRLQNRSGRQRHLITSAEKKNIASSHLADVEAAKSQNLIISSTSRQPQNSGKGGHRKISPPDSSPFLRSQHQENVPSLESKKASILPPISSAPNKVSIHDNASHNNNIEAVRRINANTVSGLRYPSSPVVVVTSTSSNLTKRDKLEVGTHKEHPILTLAINSVSKLTPTDLASLSLTQKSGSTEYR